MHCYNTNRHSCIATILTGTHAFFQCSTTSQTCTEFGAEYRNKLTGFEAFEVVKTTIVVMLVRKLCSFAGTCCIRL